MYGEIGTARGYRRGFDGRADALPSSHLHCVVMFVLCVIVSAVTLQPAICALVDHRITRGRLPVGHREQPDGEERTLGLRWAALVARFAATARGNSWRSAP